MSYSKSQEVNDANSVEKDPKEEVMKMVKEKCKIFTDPKALLEHFLSDPLLYVSYMAFAIYYFIFSHIHLLTLSYCCTTYRNIKSIFVNDFSILTMIVICYNIYQIYCIFYPSA